MGKFIEFKKKNSQYLFLMPNESVKVTYKGEESAVEGVNKFGTKCMKFTFGTEDGDKLFEITAMSVVAQFDSYKEGDVLKIDRGDKGAKPSLTITKEGDSPF